MFELYVFLLLRKRLDSVAEFGRFFCYVRVCGR